MDCDDGVSFCLYSVPTRYSLFYSGSSYRSFVQEEIETGTSSHSIAKAIT
jgi:hypothetical protein